MSLSVCNRFRTKVLLRAANAFKKMAWSAMVKNCLYAQAIESRGRKNVQLSIEEMKAAAALRGLCCSRRSAWASSVSPARALACDALSAARLAFVTSSSSSARALACLALSAACLAWRSVWSSFSRISLLFMFVLSRRLLFPASDSFDKRATRRALACLAFFALWSFSSPLPLTLSRVDEAEAILP